MENNRQKFSLTSPNFTGEVLFEFVNGKLAKFDISTAVLNERQHAVLARNLPVTLDGVKAWMARSRNATFIEIVKDVTFEMFWKRYFQGRPADNSSKKRTRIKFEKMTKAEQVKAFGYIGRYLAQIAPGTVPKHAETYLNAELWNN
jgi:hypothetical protein